MLCFFAMRSASRYSVAGALLVLVAASGGCRDGKPALPSSVSVHENVITFTLPDKGYRQVLLGSSVRGGDNWDQVPMEYHGDFWEVSTFYETKRIRYSFLADSIWIADPSNNNVSTRDSIPSAIVRVP